MAKTKISEWSTTPASNTDIDGINIAEGCAPSGINDAIRDLMAQVRSWQSGASGDPFNGPMNGTIGATTAYSGAFTTVSATGVITSTLATGTAPLTIASTTKVTNLNADLLDGADWASPAALGSTTPAAVSATTLSASGTVSGTGFSNYLASPPAIGGTTAAAGSFTTLTTSSTVTLNGGTANGVTYLNGSKVLTSGSALTFDGSVFQTSLGTGLVTNTKQLVLNNFSGEGVGITFSRPTDSTEVNAIGTASSSWELGLFGREGIVFAIGGGSTYSATSEAMRLTSTGLGIGTSSPQNKFVVSNGGAAGFEVDPAAISGATYSLFINRSTSAFIDDIRRASTYQWRDSTGSEQMRLDSSGNLGIGTSSPSYRLTVASSSTDANNVLTGSGIVVGTTIGLRERGNSNGISGTTYASQIYQGASGGGWLEIYNVSASYGLVFGTNSTERMRLDSAGNLGLGVTPSAWAGFTALQVKNSALWSDGNTAFLSANTYYSSGYKYIASAAASQYLQASGAHSWYTAASGTAGTAISFTQAMTLDASGNLALGTTTAGCRIDVVSPNNTSLNPTIRVNSNNVAVNSALAYDGLVGSGEFELRTSSAAALKFGTNGTERARIDSSGNFYVGATALSSDANYFAYSSGNAFSDFGHSTGVASTTPYTRFLYAGSSIGSITQSGTTAVLYNTTSDQRLKENIADADSASSLIDSLQVRKFDWKSDGSHQRYGFVAQELVTVAPEAVHQPTDTEEMMAVDYSKLVPMLVKEIQSLRARVAQLETN